jgi:hypothetical protein
MRKICAYDRTVRVYRVPEAGEISAIWVDSRLFEYMLLSGDGLSLVLAGDNGPHLL